MKSTKTYLLIAIIGILTSCNQPPEKYEEGVKNLNEKNWEQAIDCFNLITSENKEWLDSAKMQKNKALQEVITAEQWEKLVKIADKNKNDSLVKTSVKSKLVSFFDDNLKKNGAIKTLNTLDKNKASFSSLIDSTTKKNIITKVEDNYFTGVWEAGRGDLKGNEIVFERKDNQLNGNSNVNKMGWVKNSPIYKNLNYKEGQEWGVMPKIFQTSFWGNTSTYFGKKGILKIISSDSILVDYKTINLKCYYIRKKGAA